MFDAEKFQRCGIFKPFILSDSLLALPSCMDIQHPTVWKNQTCLAAFVAPIGRGVPGNYEQQIQQNA